MSDNKSDMVRLLNPNNAKYSGQEKVNAEIFTALKMMGRKLERTEAERDLLANRLEMLESGATLDEDTGKIYLPAVIDEKDKKKLSSNRSTFLTFTSSLSTVLAACAFALVLFQNPDFTVNRFIELKDIFINSGLTATEQVVMIEEDELIDSEAIEVIEAVKAEPVIDEVVADSKEFKKEEVSSSFKKVLEEQSNAEQITKVKEVEVIKVKVDNKSTEKKTDIIPEKEKVKQEEKIVIKSPVAVSKKSNKVEIKKSDVISKDINLIGDIKKLEQAAFNGVPEAQHDLGVYYAEGKSVNKNYKRAVYWLNKATLNGVSNASYNLAVMYQQGLGIKQDLAESMKYYNYAVELGHPEAMYNLGIIYFTGNGVDKNLSKGVGYFKRAANMGVIEAAFNLGVLYESDVIGEANIEKAKEWYNKAASKGYKQAQESIKRIENSIYAKSTISKVAKDKKTDNIINR